MKIKCLSLWEPWASAMARGFKRNETRHWLTSYRGPLAIHAAKKKFKNSDYEHGFISFLRGRGLLENPGCGEVLCIVDLKKIPRTELAKRDASFEELELGDYSEGRYAWVTDNLRTLPKPYPLTGHQGLFDWEVPKELEYLLSATEPLLSFEEIAVVE